jgi:two-component system KDP operon response regulator KdpE
MKRGSVLIVDDKPAVVQALQAEIRSLGLEPLWTPCGHEAIRIFLDKLPDAVILRDALPDLSGWETARLIRAISDAPIIFLCDHPDRLSRNRALQLGDDYMSAPWQWERLPARLAALLKRPTTLNTDGLGRYNDGYLSVDISGQVATCAGRPVALSQTEFKLLSCFVSHPNRALSYAEILQSVWCHSYSKAKAGISQYVGYLRRKLEADPARPAYFRSIRGIGYMFVTRL